MGMGAAGGWASSTLHSTPTASASASSPPTACATAIVTRSPQALGTSFWARCNCISKCPPCPLGMHVSVFEAGHLLHPAPPTASPCVAGHWLLAAPSPWLRSLLAHGHGNVWLQAPHDSPGSHSAATRTPWAIAAA